MTKTVTSLFHNGQHAATAASRLEQAGIPRDGIDIWSVPINLAPVLEDAGVPHSDAQAYVEGVRRGGSVIIVSCSDDAVDEVVRILDDEGMLDISEQEAFLHAERAEKSTAVELTDSITPFPQTDRTASEPSEASYNQARVQPRPGDRPART